MRGEGSFRKRSAISHPADGSLAVSTRLECKARRVTEASNVVPPSDPLDAAHLNSRSHHVRG